MREYGFGENGAHMNLIRKYLRLKEKALLFLKRPYMNARIARLKYDGVTIGNNCRIFTDLLLSEPYLLRIGNDVSISVNCSIITQ